MSDPKAPIFTKPFLLGTFVNFLFYVNYFMLMVTMTAYCALYYTDNVSIAGFCASIFIIGAVVARFIGGAVIEQLGRGRVLVLCAGAITVLSLAYFINLGLVFILVIRFLHGVSYGLGQTAITTIVTDIVPESRKGEGVGYFMLAVTFGAAIGPFVGLGLCNSFGYFALFATAVGVGFVCLFCSLAVKRLEGSSEKIEGKTSSDQPRKASSFSLRSFVEFGALPIATVVACAFLSYGVVITYIEAFATEADLLTASSFFFIAYSAAMFVGRPFTGKLFDRKGDFPVMLIGFSSLLLSTIVLSWVNSPIMLLICAALMGLGIGSIQPSGLTLAIQKAPTSRLATANATYFMIIDIGIGLVPFLFGWMIPLLGYRGLFTTLIGVVIATFVLYLFFRKIKALY